MSSSSVAQRPTTAVAAAVPGGLVIAVLGAMAAFAPAATDGVWWFLTAAVAASLLSVAILALRSRVDGVARPALAVAGVGMALFALAHVYTLVDADTAILLFSVFLVVLALGVDRRGDRARADVARSGPVRAAAVRGVAARDDPGGRGARRPAALRRDRRLGAVLGRVRRAHAFSVNRASIRSREPPINGGCATWQAGGGRATRTACCPARPGVWWRSCCPPPVSSRARPCLRPRWPSRPSSMRRPPSSC